jgi:hypothetical protein
MMHMLTVVGAMVIVKIKSEKIQGHQVKISTLEVFLNRRKLKNKKK